MVICNDEFYHIYNQGNNKQQLFYEQENYEYFIQLMLKFVTPNCELLAWCLMPNHFHFLIRATEKSVEEKPVGSLKLTVLSNGIRMLQTSYTAAFNKRYAHTGSLFRQKSKFKHIDTDISGSYLNTCFHYIHQNPLKAGCVNRMEDWKFSSFNEYCGMSSFQLVNLPVGNQVLDIDLNTFITDSYETLNDELVEKIAFDLD